MPTLRSTAFAIWLKDKKILWNVLIKLRWLMRTKGIVWMCRSFGIQFLGKSETTAYLQPYQLISHSSDKILLPEVSDLQHKNKIYFSQTDVVTEPVQVWCFPVLNTKAELLPYGGIILNKKVLCTDTDNNDFVHNIVHRGKRKSFHTQTLIAPWSHYLDGYVWGGYYDFLILLAGKLCRIKAALPKEVFNEAVIAYPLFNTPYELEYLKLLDIDPDRVKDSRMYNITFNQCILGNVGHWFYPNLADIELIRNYIRSKIPLTGHYEGNHIYISRACRRRIINEEELIDLLKKYDFQIVEDKPRSVAEQIDIYQNARVIIGPHGASFSNILWCQPGTHLLELFSPNYTPGFFRYLAELLGLSYSAYYHRTAEEGNWSKGLEEDIFVDITELNRYIMKLLNH